MKAQQDVIAPVMMVGIFIAVVASVYMWGLPLIDKNKGLVYIEKGEAMMNDIVEKIKTVASSGGKETFLFDLPGKIMFSTDGTTGAFYINMQAKGTKYGLEYNYYFTNNRVNMRTRNFGDVDPVLAYVFVEKFGDKYLHTYYISTTPLNQSSGCSYIKLDGKKFTAGQGAEIELQYAGTETVTGNPSFPSYCQNRPVVIRTVEVLKKG